MARSQLASASHLQAIQASPLVPPEKPPKALPILATLHVFLLISKSQLWAKDCVILKHDITYPAG